MYEYLDRRYALALYEVAESKGKVDEYLQDLREICDLIENNHDFYEVIRHPQINTRRKKQTFINIFKGKIDEELLSFLLILIEKDRILYLREKLNEMEKIDLERKNTLKGVIRTAVPLLSSELESLKNIFEKKYDKNIIFETKVDRSVLGGVYVRVGNDVIDDTVKSKIEEMKDIMLRKK
ncbi:F0F1 ATP synthase subunit delta [uncultured Clostridium sp.]|uniref:F0F1 ATP synthase subunit delta n=1 Tax=uncultured Clostridium sp. TaxID=59620 RepID=UPI0025EA0F2C|nr:F0F1 ATP synthase subunit delta [uncultured Clostridium sp.]